MPDDNFDNPTEELRNNLIQAVSRYCEQTGARAVEVTFSWKRDVGGKPIAYNAEVRIAG